MSAAELQPDSLLESRVVIEQLDDSSTQQEDWRDESLVALCLTAGDEASVRVPHHHHEDISTWTEDLGPEEVRQERLSRVDNDDLDQLVECCSNLRYLCLMNVDLDDYGLNQVLQLKKLQFLRLFLKTQVDREAGGASAEDTGDQVTGVTFNGFLLFLKYAFHPDRQVRFVELSAPFRLSREQLVQLNRWSEQESVDHVELLVEGGTEELAPLAIQALVERRHETPVDGLTIGRRHEKVTSRAHSPVLTVIPRRQTVHRRLRNLFFRSLALCLRQP